MKWVSLTEAVRAPQEEEVPVPPATAAASQAQEWPGGLLDGLGLITRSDVLSDVLRGYAEPKDVAERVQQRAHAAALAAQKYQWRKDRNTAIGTLLGTILVSVVQALFTGPRHLLPLGIGGAALLPLAFLLLWLTWLLAEADLEEQRSKLIIPEQHGEVVMSSDFPGFREYLRQSKEVNRDLIKDERNNPVLIRGVGDFVVMITVALLGLGLALFLGVYAGWWPMFATLVAAAVCVVVGWQVGSLLVDRPDPIDPRYAVIAVFLKLAAQAVPQSFDERWHRQTPDWRNDTAGRARFAWSLERAGRDVRRLAPKLAPWSGDLRQLMRDRAERMAAGFHKLALAVTLGGRDRDKRIAESLLVGFVAACIDDWEALTETDPQPLRRHAILGWIRRSATRAAFAGVLAGAGAVLLLVMDKSAQQQQIVFTLWAAALAALASPPRDALGRVADRVEALAKGSGSS
jgi:hypothetical protein